MKKPGKPKPKRRAQKNAPQNASPAAGSRQNSVAASGKAKTPKAAASTTAKKPAKPAVRPKAAARRPSARSSAAAGGYTLLPILQPLLQPIAIRAASARTAVLHSLEAYPSDDRSALGLLLLPFLILAASLGLSQTWRYTMHALPEISLQVPYSRPLISPIQRAPDIVVPGSLVYPNAAPPISVASLDVRAPEALVRDVVVPGTLAYPTAAPTIIIASVDVSKPQLGPAAPAKPAPEVTWTPPQPEWTDRLRQPPAIDVAPPSIAEAPTSPPSEICQASTVQVAGFSANGRMARSLRMPIADASKPYEFGLKLATAARAQTNDLVIYSARYHHMAYPMGDMPSFYGACTDVIIRAYRAVGIDLQELVQRTHSGRGDTNIDHRRTETLRTLFSKAGASLPITRFPEDYKPGDVVTYHRPFSRVSSSHIAMVSDVLAPSGRPMIVHNRGWGPQLEDALFVDRITGHYRYTGPVQGPPVNPVVEAVASPPAATPASARGLVRASFPGATTVAGVRPAVLGLRRHGRVLDGGTTGPSPSAH